MLCHDVIIKKISNIQNCLHRITVKTRNKLNWTDDIDIKDIVVFNLINAIQLCLYIASIIIVENKWDIPKTFTGSFVTLENNHVIDKLLCQKMCKMVGFRNIATHAYKEINYQIVKIIVDQYLEHFENYYSQILTYIDQGRDSE